MQKTNILEICNEFGIGGTEKTIEIFCKFLDKNKYNLYACGISKGGLREEKIRNVVSDLFVANGNIDLIKKFVIEKNINIVHFHLLSQKSGIEYEKKIELLKFLKEKNIKIIETSPFSYFFKEIDDLLDIKLFVSKTNLLKYFYKYGKYIKKDKYSFLYNPLDIELLEKFKITEIERKNIREKYGISEKDFVIGKVGRASLWKWDDTIIDIVPQLIKKINNLKIVIRAIPKEKINKIKNMGFEKYFILLDESADEKTIYDTYQIMDVMLHTSRIGESFGIAITEGMFFGLPIITKSTDFLSYTIFDRDNAQVEIVNNELNGFVRNKLNDIIDCIVELNKNKKLYNEISKRNNLDIIERFNAKDLTKRLEYFFDNDKININDDFSIKEYKNKLVKESYTSLFIESIKAIYEKFILK